jgi:hypothetical protein
VLPADEAVRSAISQVYALFAQLGSARQVMVTLRERGLLLPRRKAGSRRVTWAEASYPAAHGFLTNPAYGGSVRVRPHPHRKARGRVREGDQHRPGAAAGETWRIMHTDYRRPIDTFAATISAVIGLHFWRGA